MLGSCRPLNLVCVAQGSETTIKLIDFDASAKYGELCHLKFSSAFAPPQLAAELLEYESATGYKPTDVSAPQPWSEWIQSRKTLIASVSIDVWAFGILAFKLCVEDGASMFHSSEADNIVSESELHILAYYWELHKLEKVSEIMRLGPEWFAAADLLLWCLQTKPERRPQSFGDVLGHRFLNPDGQLRYFESAEETMAAFVQRQAKALTAAIASRNKDEVQQQLDDGVVHLRMIDDSIPGSSATPLMKSAFLGEPTVTRVLLDEIADAWPETVRQAYLDQRTSLGFTAYMIACICGHVEIAEMLATKGCSTKLVNSSGKTGADLLQAFENEREQSSLTPYKHGYRLQRCYDSLESYMVVLERMLDNDMEAGIKVWNAKLAAYHLGREQMAQLEATIKALLAQSFDIALHFTDFNSCGLILSGKGIRASVVGQLGGGVSVCLRSLFDFGWGGNWEDFCLTVGKALWGKSYRTDRLPQMRCALKSPTCPFAFCRV